MSYERNACAALAALGLNPGKHLPAEALPAQQYTLVNGKHAGTQLNTFLRSKAETKPRGHRLMAECPHCGNAYTVGCIEQHLDACVKKVQLRG